MHMTWYALHQVPHHSWANSSPRLEDSITQFGHSGSGSHPCLGSRPPSNAKHVQWGSCHALTPSWSVHDIHILLWQKSSHITYCVGCGIVLDNVANMSLCFQLFILDMLCSTYSMYMYFWCHYCVMTDQKEGGGRGFSGRAVQVFRCPTEELTIMWRHWSILVISHWHWKDNQ